MGSRKSEVGGRRSEVGGRRSVVGGRRSAVGGPKSEVRSPKSEVRSPSSAFVVNSAEEFARVAENECLKVKVLYIPKEDITQAEEQLHQRWNACIPIPETHSIHYVAKLSDTTVSVAKNSQFLKQDTCTEHVLLSSFGPRVDDSATTNITTQKTARVMDQKPQSSRCKKRPCARCW